jgi:hypothetical protein
VLVRAETEDGAAPARVEWRAADGTTRASPLLPANGGLLAADVDDDASALDVVASDGNVLATAGLDRPAPPEYRDPRPADLEAIAALACSGERGRGRPLLPWFAGAAVLLALASVAAGRVKSAAPRAR